MVSKMDKEESVLLLHQARYNPRLERADEVGARGFYVNQGGSEGG